MDAIEICGVAIRFDQWGRPTDRCHAMLARPNCFDRTSRPIALLLDHQEDTRFATTQDAALQVWADQTAVFFRAALPWTRRNAGLARMVRDGQLREASVRFADDRESVMHVDGGEEVVRSDLIEISIVASAAQDGTATWLADEPIETLPLAVQRARALWGRSSMAAALHAERAGR